MGFDCSISVGNWQSPLFCFNHSTAYCNAKIDSMLSKHSKDSQYQWKQFHRDLDLCHEVTCFWHDFDSNDINCWLSTMLSWLVSRLLQEYWKSSFGFVIENGSVWVDWLQLSTSYSHCCSGHYLSFNLMNQTPVQRMLLSCSSSSLRCPLSRWRWDNYWIRNYSSCPESH
jgi:hypothetical protein